MPTPPTTWPKRLRSIRRREARRQSATHAVEAGGRTYPLSPLRGVEWPGRMVDFARLIHRPVRVLGGPAVPAACGGNQMPTHSARQGMPATGALTTRLGAAPRPQPSDAKQPGARGGLCIGRR
jgi:hypothetical protein